VLTAKYENRKKKSLKGDITQHHIDIQAPFNDFFAVFDPLPLTLWMHCSFSYL